MPYISPKGLSTELKLSSLDSGLLLLAISGRMFGSRGLGMTSSKGALDSGQRSLRAESTADLPVLKSRLAANLALANDPPQGLGEIGERGRWDVRRLTVIRYGKDPEYSLFTSHK